MKWCIGIFLVAAIAASAQTNSLTALLQQGLFEEQASRNLDAAIASYQKLAGQFDQDRQLAATAVFRLGECYRAQGKTNEAAAHYQRIVRDFSDQTVLATLSRQNLGGMGAGKTEAAVTATASVENPDAQLLKKLEGKPFDELEKILPTVMPDAALDELLKQRNESKRDLAAKQSDYGTNHPNVVRVRTLVEKLDEQITEKIGGMMQGLKLRSDISGGTKMSGTVQVSTEARLLAAQIAGVEKLKADPKEQARASLAFFPDEPLKSMLEELSRLEMQESVLKTNSQLVEVMSADHNAYPAQLGRYRQAVGTDPNGLAGSGLRTTNVLDDARRELRLQNTAIEERVNFIAEIQKARLKALQAGAPPESLAGNSKTDLALPAVVDEEATEIARIEKLIQNSPDLINAPSQGANGNLTLLHQAAASGQLRVAKFLLDHGADADAYFGAALFGATRAGNRAMVELLLSRGANVNADAADVERNTPLHVAAQKGFPAVVESLLAGHAKVNAPTKDGTTPLFSAVRGRQLKIVQMLLAAGADVNLKDKQDRTVLNYAIANSPEIFQVLLNAGTNPNTEDSANRTPLSFAVERDSPAVVKQLLAAKADPNAGKVNAPLLVAIHEKNVAVAEMLLQAGANPNLKGQVNWGMEYGGVVHQNAEITPLFLAVSTGQLPLVQLLLKYKADPNDAQTDKRAVIFSALGNEEILRALLDAGAKADVLDEVSTTRLNNRSVPLLRTPLMEVAGRDDGSNSVAILLHHGAKANVRDALDDTPLHRAAANLSVESVFTALFERQADPNVRNQAGQTPLDIAKQGLVQPVYAGRFHFKDSNGTYFNAADDGQRIYAEKIIALLRAHGALDQLPDWDRITVSRPAANFSQPVFTRSSNDWNQFSLLELVYDKYQHRSTQLDFADLSRIVVVRPSTNGAELKRLPVNLLNGTNGLEVSRDFPLEFGDVVEIPEREHALAEHSGLLSDEEARVLFRHLQNRAGEARLVVAGSQTVQLPLPDSYSYVQQMLIQPKAQAALTSSSDLSRVKVSRRNARTGKAEEWIVDCRPPESRNGGGRFGRAAGMPGGAISVASGTFTSGMIMGTVGGNSSSDEPYLWLRDGDVIEVPQK